MRHQKKHQSYPFIVLELLWVELCDFGFRWAQNEICRTDPDTALIAWRRVELNDKRKQLLAALR